MVRQIIFIVAFVVVMAVVWNLSNQFVRLIPESYIRPVVAGFLCLCAGFLFGRWHGLKFPSVRDD